VFVTALAKNPADRFPSCQDFTTEVQRRLTPPIIHVQDTQRAPARSALVPPPPQPSKRRVWRPRVVIPALVAIVVLIAGGVFASIKLAQHRNPTANTGSFTGRYQADYGPGTDLEGKPVAGSPPITGAWDVRSVCRSSGCVATASYIGSSGTVIVPSLVFDQVGRNWVAVGLGSVQCNDTPAEAWVVFTLQPHPDGTLSGETTRATSNGCSSGKRTVTFTRTGDVDVASVPDPGNQAPRVVSSSAALRGRYHETTTYANGNNAPQEYDLTVRTECLRTGDRCLSLFHAPDGVVTLVFGSEKWTRDEEGTAQCATGGMAQVRITAEFPLPEPLQDPIPLLTGHGHTASTESACPGGDFDTKFERIGD
jgi:serine/threonine protein kinase, bacterial